MDSIRINTGSIKLVINDGPEVLEFNPADVIFVENFYSMISDFQMKQDSYLARAKEIDSRDEVDANGIRVNFPEAIALAREICEYMNSKIDTLFGEGISQALFGSSLIIENYSQFFALITPYIKSNREALVGKYTKPVKGTRKVMK